ncbi:hypothetical protein GCM10009854_46710 [Saccharopolyspora halophila]|uniref:Uncharacterized protein n=1 Tax=Saccharopolyspora halophila TaxID=405551 RepID=A0ABP5TY27_9PSEU
MTCSGFSRESVPSAGKWASGLVSASGVSVSQLRCRSPTTGCSRRFRSWWTETSCRSQGSEIPVAQGEGILPVIGARRLDQVETMIESTRVMLGDAEPARLEELVPGGAARGDRYRVMADSNSER